MIAKTDSNKTPLPRPFSTLDVHFVDIVRVTLSTPSALTCYSGDFSRTYKKQCLRPCSRSTPMCGIPLYKAYILLKFFYKYFAHKPVSAPRLCGFSSHLLVVNKSTVSNGFGRCHASFLFAACRIPDALSDSTKLNLGLKSEGSLSIPPGLLRDWGV